MKEDVLKSLARLMQQTAVKQAVQERALRRLLAFVPPEHAAKLAAALESDAEVVREDFSGGIDQPMVAATIAFELKAMLEVLNKTEPSS